VNFRSGVMVLHVALGTLFVTWTIKVGLITLAVFAFA
jgi:hypothetical protein